MRKYILACLQYTKYVLRHKYYVGIACFRMWLYRQWIVHDLSKFHPSEFFGYMERYYLNKREWDPNKDGINYARNHHQKYNKHHPEYWVLIEKTQITPLEMPEKYIKEMLCDWWWTGRTFMKQEDIRKYKYCNRFEVYAFYEENMFNMLLHPNTKQYIARFLDHKRLNDEEDAYANWWYWYLNEFYK